MPEFLRYRMKPKDDLAVRTDFTADVMAAAKDRLQQIVDGSPEIQELRSRAAVDVRLAGTLSDIQIDISVVPTPGADMSREEIETVQQSVGQAIGDRFRDSLSDILQQGIDSARRRM